MTSDKLIGPFIVITVVLIGIVIITGSIVELIAPYAKYKEGDIIITELDDRKGQIIESRGVFNTMYYVRIKNPEPEKTTIIYQRYEKIWLREFEISLIKEKR